MVQRTRKNIKEMVTDSQIEALVKSVDTLRPELIPADIHTYMDALKELEGITPLQRRFLGAYAICGIVSRASMAVGLPTSRHYGWLKTGEEYRVAFAEATQISNEYLEGLALELASGMRQKPVVSMGKIVTYESIYDTRLLTVLLKARMPDKYGNKVDVTSGGQPIVKVIDKDTYDAI